MKQTRALNHRCFISIVTGEKSHILALEILNIKKDIK